MATLSWLGACGGGGANDNFNLPQCSDGKDNDGDGLIDFPDDPGCNSANATDEGHAPWPQCQDGRDNDGDGKVDYPDDPGCPVANQDSEVDDCPDGPHCPQCSNGKDDDDDGTIDFPADPGCSSASDSDEIEENPFACSSTVMAHPLPANGHVTGMLAVGGASTLSSPHCGGSGTENIYALHITKPTVVTATSDLAGSIGADQTPTDTVLYIRGSDCANPNSELGCDDDATPAATLTGVSSLAVSIPTPGTYYLVVDAHDSGTGGPYEIQVEFFAGEGESCDTTSACGPGLVCRTPMGMTEQVCSKHVCSDGVDDDGDGKLDYPTDPGCTSPDDDDETDTCPGAGCPECSDGIDNDNDGKTDYPTDPSCSSAADVGEHCTTTDGVSELTSAVTFGTTVGAHHDVTLGCAGSSETGGDKTYRLDLPKLASLSIATAPEDSFDAVTALFGATCGGTPVGGAGVGCEDTSAIKETNLAAGAYYVVVGAYSGDTGSFSLTVDGTIANGDKCESSLTTAGALHCNPGYGCKGNTGAKTCQKTACSDGVDNNGDGKIDYPNDPGCTSPSDDAEDNVCPGVDCPVCADGMDNDADGKTDFAQDLSCWAASATTEAFCNGVDVDRALGIAASTVTGTTTGMHNDFATQSCRASAGGNDVELALVLPVPVKTLTVDTNGSAFDTLLSFRDSTCSTELACDDDGGDGSQSVVTVSNLAAGTYAVVLDGYGSASGAFTVHTHGLVANGTACTSPLFASGVLACTAPATCSGGTCH